jgi:indolepyruvate ferredoxin oxidoreductase, beta subunit
MKNPIFGNILLVGALAATAVLPLNKDDFETTITQTMPADKVQLNMQAFEMGSEMIN